ncbi:MAG: tandem-95 repeat protein, partial [Anaerolineae bacterium]|nr:tandem-95 repeat protein [Anaerolineae bacterium]
DFCIPLNSAPIAQDDSDTTDEDTPIVLSVLDNDTDPDNDPLTITALGLPQFGLATTNGTTVVYTPTTNFNGFDVYTYTVSDGNGHNDTATITTTVSPINDAPVLSFISNQVISATEILTFNAIAIDPDFPDDVLTFSLINPPSGASIVGSSGVFTWTPTLGQGGNVYNLTVVVSDNGTPVLTDSQEIQITVNEINQPPVIADIEDHVINENELLTVTVTATDTNDLLFSLINEPAGSTLEDITGATNQVEFTWTPTEQQGPGVYTPTIVIEDLGAPGTTYTQSFTITVNEVNQAPVLAAIGDQSVKVNNTLSFTASSTDTDIPANALSYKLTHAPAGASINSSSGVFSWTPSQTGTYTATVSVSDNGSPTLSDSETINITVIDDRPPQSTPNKVFLPIIVGATNGGSNKPPGESLPDLQVTLSVETDSSELSSAETMIVKVAVKNTGTVSAAPNFWVDLYVDPLPFPNEAGYVWSELCAIPPNPSTNPCIGDYGIAWQIQETIEPGEIVYLTSEMDDPYISASHTVWSGSLPVGTHTLWAYVDSWNGYNVPEGFIKEKDETNNRTGPISIQITQSSNLVNPSSVNSLDEQRIPTRPLPSSE